jgi:hypothetical protein
LVISRTISFILVGVLKKKKNYSPIICSKTPEFKFLKENGYVIFTDKFKDSDISQAVQQIEKLDLINPYDSKNETFKYDSPYSGTHVGYVKESQELLNLPLVKSIIEDEELNGIIATYLGKSFKMVNIASWYTFGNQKSGIEGELFHRDIDNIAWLKLFVYLTDVDMGNGAHAFIPKSHRSLKGLTFKRYSDNEAEIKFGQIKWMLGKKGTVILEDTFGIHKGQHIFENRHRLILQLQYAVLSNAY